MRTILLFALAFSTVALFSAGKPDPVFKTKHLEFKDVKEGDIVKFSYDFTNKGTGDFILSSVKPTCGCTVVDWPKEPIKPGQSGKINVEFNSQGRAGYNAKGVNIESNAGTINLVFEVYVLE